MSDEQVCRPRSKHPFHRRWHAALGACAALVALVASLTLWIESGPELPADDPFHLTPTDAAIGLLGLFGLAASIRLWRLSSLDDARPVSKWRGLVSISAMLASIASLIMLAQLLANPLDTGCPIGAFCLLDEIHSWQRQVAPLFGAAAVAEAAAGVLLFDRWASVLPAAVTARDVVVRACRHILEWALPGATPPDNRRGKEVR